MLHLGPHATSATPGNNIPNNGVNMGERMIISQTINIDTAIKAFFGVQSVLDLYGNRVRIQRSIEIITSTHAEQI